MKAFNNFTKLLKSCPTKDFVAIVEKIDKGSRLPKNSIFEYWIHLNEGDAVVIWNHDTKRLSNKIVKENTKGKYFKVSGRTFYLKDFRIPGSGSIVEDIYTEIQSHFEQYLTDTADDIAVFLNTQTYDELIKELHQSYQAIEYPITGFSIWGVKVFCSTNTYKKIQVIKMWKN